MCQAFGEPFELGRIQKDMASSLPNDGLIRISILYPVRAHGGRKAALSPRVHPSSDQPWSI